MKDLKRIFAGILAVTAVLGVTACGDSSSSSSSEDVAHYKSQDDVSVSADENEIKGENAVDISGQTIYWLADYDINPQTNNDRSVALSLFEDVYGAKVEYIQTDSAEKFNTLASRILAGDPVDMFPYEWDAVPNGVTKDQYQPLDDYFDVLEWDTDLWEDMHDVADMFEYNDSHYVVPYAISDPLLITYSRSMMQAEGLDDPYELYEKGKWDWDVFMDMMKTFVANAPDGTTRYGINGWFGQAIVQSTGKTVVSNENGTFVNNINDPDIEKAEMLMEEMNSLGLYQPGWYSNFPEDGNTLFYGMSNWALGGSNAKNQDADLMIVPFPKSPDSDEYYLCCNYAAKMLVKGSDKGDAVATYIKCERLAATNEEYKEATKQKSLIVDKSASGVVRSYVTEEQYDALQTFLDPENITPVFDFGYGMGSRMYGDGDYTYETRGVMNNLMTTLLEGNENVDSWAALRDAWTGVIDEEIAKFNK